MVITEVAVLGKVQNWLSDIKFSCLEASRSAVFQFSLHFLSLVIIINFIVVYFNDSFADKVELLKVTFVPLDNLVWLLEPAEQVNDNFICESTFAFVKEMLEVLLKLVEDLCLFDESCLHLWCQLLVEWKFFNYQVEIMEESHFDITSDVIIEGRLNV